MPFPPVPVFPNAIDSDYTLYAVYNTTETKICVDNGPWAEQITIVPVAADHPEIWGDNGFANIEGELLYYDSVEKDENGKVFKLKGCARSLSGKKTKFNPKGTWIRSYVVAEHHNQLVNAILKVEDFVGFNFDPRQETLDWRIRNLRELNVIFDDFNCPDVNFTWNILENNPETGILARYIIQVTPPGSINSFRLDFGDGEFTTTSLAGEHRYALNARIDPVFTVSNDKCQMILTPVERSNPAEPPEVIQEEFSIEIPPPPDVPDFTSVPCVVPEPELTIPPVVFPCISIEGQIGPLPSVIVGPDIQLVSQVIITADQPINILHSVVTITGGFSLPSYIFVDIPPTIVVEPPIPPTIVVVPQSNVTMQMDFGELPRIEVDWGSPPDMEVALTMSRQVRTPKMFAGDAGLVNEFGDEFADLFEASNHITVEYEPVGIPSEIKILAPDPESLKIDASGIPRVIKVDTYEANIPRSIKIFGPETPIPDIIEINGSSVPREIELVNRDVPERIELVAVGVPERIVLEMERDIPNRIIVEQPNPIPDHVIMEYKGPTEFELKVVGMPDGLKLLPPAQEDMPKVEMVWNGAPIEVKLTLDNLMTQTEDGKTNCVMITPCPR